MALLGHWVCGTVLKIVLDSHVSCLVIHKSPVGEMRLQREERHPSADALLLPVGETGVGKGEGWMA